MKLRISNGNVIELPANLTADERILLVADVLDTYPADFKYQKKMFGTKFGVKQDNNNLMKIKLEILGTYIIRADEHYTSNVMSRYKEIKRPMQEVPFSQFDEDVTEINGWH